MEKDHTFSKCHSQGSYVVSLTLKFMFPLFLPPYVVSAPVRLCASKNVPKSKDRVKLSPGPMLCTFGNENVRGQEAQDLGCQMHLEKEGTLLGFGEANRGWHMVTSIEPPRPPCVFSSLSLIENSSLVSALGCLSGLNKAGPSGNWDGGKAR